MIQKIDFDFTIPSKVLGISKKELKKQRNFPGAWRGGYGPVNAPMVANGGSMISTTGYGTAADPVTFGDGGSALGEAKEAKFLNFLESLKTDNDENNILIECVINGFYIVTKKQF